MQKLTSMCKLCYNENGQRRGRGAPSSEAASPPRLHSDTPANGSAFAHAQSTTVQSRALCMYAVLLLLSQLLLGRTQCSK